MKKYILGIAALAVALIGFGGLRASTTYANPAKIWVINSNVATFLNGAGGAPVWTALTAADVANLDTWATASGNQINSDTTNAGNTYIVVSTSGSVSPMTVQGNGMTCVGDMPVAAVCDGTTGVVPVTITGVSGTFMVMHVTAVGSFVTGSTITAVQDSISVPSAAEKLVGQAHDAQLTVTPATLQQAAAVPTCTLTTAKSINNAVATAVYTDINGNALVGYGGNASLASWSSSSTATLVSAAAGTAPAPNPVSMLLADGKTIAAANVVCASTTPGTATLTFNTGTTEISGSVIATRTATVTVTGVPASIALTAAPATIACDGTATSTVTAKVTDSAGNNVVDGTPVIFNVVALGTANPISTTTTGGSASSTITPLSGGAAGVVIVVSAAGGAVQSSIRVDCLLPTPTTPPAPAATATPPGGVIVGPSTGTGGYLGQDGSAGFPMWTLIALALGSVALVAGGMVTRRAGK